jgi:thiol-disulfide isomerase/thioredoxin
MLSNKASFLVMLAVLGGCGGGDDVGGGDTSAVDRTVYPEGPYGAEIDDVIANLEFTTADGDSLSFADLRGDVEARLLLVSTAAEWCTACREEQPLLQSLADDHAGLVVMVSVFEDSDYTPAGIDEAALWRDQYELNFPVVADPDFVLSAYYDETLTPMNMLVDLDTMKIGYVTTGAIDAQFVSLIDTLLAN